MQKEFESIIESLRALLALEQLEYLDKTWLSGNNETRSKLKQDNLKHVIDRLNKLSIDVAAQNK